MPRRYRLFQVDVFSDQPLEGNPLAVLPDARGLEDAEMQAIAREMNLSETTFVLPAEAAEADYRVRIFTPEAEVPFAGHPTLGTAHVMLDTGGASLRPVPPGELPCLRQQTLAGVQPIAVRDTPTGRVLTMTQPTPRFADPPEGIAAEAAAALGLREGDFVGASAFVSVGVSWHVAQLRDLATLTALDPDQSALTKLDRRLGLGTTVFCEGAEDPGCAVRLRSFAPGFGVPEDPVCGSGNGCVGAFRARRDALTTSLEYRAEQGIEVGRPGRVDVQVDCESSDPRRLRVRVGGRCVTVVEGELELP